MRADLPRYIDVQYLAITTLVKNKDKLNKLMRGLGDDAMAFVRRSGIYFGLVIGLVQMVAWALFQNPWIMPAFGFGVGFISDYIALNMLFRPVKPTKILGFIPFQGAAARPTRDRHRGLRTNPVRGSVLPPRDPLRRGFCAARGSDKVFSLIAKEVDAAIDAQTGIATPLVKFAVGTERYNALKNTLVEMVLQRLPETLQYAQDYAVGAMDLEGTIIDKMGQLSNEEYESILRPVFKDDEPTMIAVGAVWVVSSARSRCS